jgi:hypothetical protein
MKRTLAGLSAAAAAALAASAAPAAGHGACTGQQAVQTAHYLVAIHVGPSEEMVSAKEAKARHLKTGEIMVSGSMAMGMSMSKGADHLEVHVCSKSSGAVVKNAHPSIMLTDLTAKGKPVMVPVAVMYGIQQGPKDLHYGNNVMLKAGHHYSVTVTVSGERAVFKITAPGMHM